MFCSKCQNHYFWWLWSECSPLPIPNREVKPHIADDTALVCGKVGRRQSFIRASHSGCSFFIYTLYITPRFCPFQILMLICQKRVALADFTSSSRRGFRRVWRWPCRGLRASFSIDYGVPFAVAFRVARIDVLYFVEKDSNNCNVFSCYTCLL